MTKLFNTFEIILEKLDQGQEQKHTKINKDTHS
jgi:hypothetical protein